MNEKDFASLMIAVKGKDQAEIRGAEVKSILTDLLKGEFAEIKETRFRIMLQEPPSGGAGAVNKVNGQVNLWINPSNWKDNPGFSQARLESLIRHELLHLSTGLDDDDPLFRLVAKRHGIDLWRRS